ncbi:uncharacterized protein STEHIDRAFT_144693 [Stereum hirsutum FP-91666 SS1]|uniref:uncharacterized protein n=1 Tax=Stereum hirsutum (strain FP-91666) TaxID=721885 RepID=UPI000440F453|nr:uncharacterized protein STEHIDRAFT_144693 [Stereum hirsutum FP-91666 SS1]EIM91379.1 hypothetical protein STEHIDRAFT_144693 [Stereum hirsutum FP-91666 SS1]
MSSDNRDNFPHSEPIPIGNSPSRRRGVSFSSTDSSPSSPPIQTPVSAYSPKVATSPSASSPILSYFLSSPTKPSTFPFRTPPFGNAPVFEDEEAPDPDGPPSSMHARRASTAWGGNSRLPATPAQPAPVPAQHSQHQRGVGVLRRLSLGGGFRPSGFDRTGSPPSPSTPPPSTIATSPPVSLASPASGERRARRATTLAVRAPEKPKRAPSPMGERILKGHFDGFN